jgi:hypothetical protein
MLCPFSNGEARQRTLSAALCAHRRGRRRLALLAGAQRALERGAEFLVHALALLAGPPAALLVAGLRRVGLCEANDDLTIPRVKGLSFADKLAVDGQMAAHALAPLTTR